jgi:hypothetical protein
MLFAGKIYQHGGKGAEYHGKEPDREGRNAKNFYPVMQQDKEQWRIVFQSEHDKQVAEICLCIKNSKGLIQCKITPIEVP